MTKDPQTPIATCSAETCSECPVEETLQCHFTLRDWIYFLIIVYALTTTGFFWTLKAGFCTRCMNMACPLNSVRDEVREAFFDRNPSVAEAWGRQASK